MDTQNTRDPYTACQEALDHLYNTIHIENFPTKNDYVLALVARSKKTTESYSSRLSIDYGDPLVREAYIRVYHTGHFDLFAKILGKLLNQAFDQPGDVMDMHIAAVGCGSAPEFHGFELFLAGIPPEVIPKINLHLYDKTNAWKPILDFWETQSLPNFSSSFDIMDLLSENIENDWSNFRRMSMFTFQYLFTALLPNISPEKKFCLKFNLEKLFENATEGALVVMVDVVTWSFPRQYVPDFLKQISNLRMYKVIEEPNGIYRARRPELGEYFSPDHDPHININYICVVYKVNHQNSVSAGS